jgi:putative phosphoribosyl transferase
MEVPMDIERKQPALPMPIEVRAGDLVLHGDLAVPREPCGVVLFAHGSGSGRASPRNRAVARSLEAHGFATLLLDLLSIEEERREALGATLRFDVELLARRLDCAADELERRPDTRNLPIGLFGASTGAAAALITASRRPSVHAVVSRGGRPDLAGAALAGVHAATRLIVGGNDEVVLDLNRRALAQLTCEKDLVIVRGATHLFEERGALEQVADLAGEWFTWHLAGLAYGNAT